MTIDEIMRLAFWYAVAFEIHGRNQEADGLSAKQDYAEKMLRSAIEQYGKEGREKVRDTLAAVIKELREG